MIHNWPFWLMFYAWLVSLIHAGLLRRERDRARRQRDHLALHLQRLGWLVAIGCEETLVMRDPEAVRFKP